MSSIRGRDTRPELLVRSYLHRAGLRFRLHARDLPGRPDLVFPRHRAAVFVHGCFWHRHDGCRFTTTPATRVAFWRDKFRQNVVRDTRNAALLRSAGWRVFTIWECEASKEEVLDWLFFWLVSGADG
jgi:DNA mismatch endonuclease, patch repair protein